jgi:hypothetical protein
MTMSSILTVVISVTPGVAVAVFSLAYSARQSRGNGNLARAMGFFDLHDRLADRGPIDERGSSKVADQAHADLLTRLEREGRANSYLFMRSAARLERPGDFVFAPALVIYGGALIVGAMASLANVRVLATADGISALIGFAALATVGVPVFITGLVRLVRRIDSRRIRRAIGLMDASTLEGLEANVRGFVNLVRRVRRLPSSPPAVE